MTDSASQEPGDLPDGIEVEIHDGVVTIRDSTKPGEPVLTFTVEEWEAFRGGVAKGEFDIT